MNMKCSCCGEKLDGQFWIITELSPDYYASSPYLSFEKANKVMVKMNAEFKVIISDENLKKMRTKYTHLTREILNMYNCSHTG
jgi:hypothetical protein